MTAIQTKELCMNLLNAEFETDVVQLLKDAGYWDNESMWRHYGDRENNYSQIGNQQGRSDAALAEKIVNSIDHCLLNKCLEAGIDPESPQAPQSIREAVALFYEGKATDGNSGGTIAEWSTARRTEVAQNIAIAITGEKKKPCVTIVDQGEGQTPDRMPATFLSLGANNKMRIPFVQGKFNMGSTGVLEFCGKQNLQLIITRRNPALVASEPSDSSSDQWAFTIVRRQNPTGNARNSVYSYLAPINADTSHGTGGVLRFMSSTLPLMPDKRNAAVRKVPFGSLVKLYEYDMKGYSSNAVMKDQLLSRLDACLPNIALPVRIHECRDGFRGHEGSFDTTLSGLSVRLEDNRGGNLVEGYPDSVPFSVQGENMTAKIYAFEDGKADTYRKGEGVIFTINGQTHGSIPKSIFNRNAVKLGRLSSSLLVIVDCTGISSRAIEMLFMASRDRLRNNTLRQELEKQIQSILKTHAGLKKLASDRRAAEIKDRLANDKPLENILDSILKRSPTLSKLFLLGQRLARPFPTNGSGKGGGGDKPGDKNGRADFDGKIHPTYFTFAKNNSDELNRTFEQGRDCRVGFKTDVVNDYFKRNSNAGEMTLQVTDGDIDVRSIGHFVNLHNGRAQLNLTFPDDIDVGTTVKIRCVVNDPTLLDSYVNTVTLTVTEKTDRPSNGGTRKRTNGSGGEGKGQSEAGIKIPKIVPVAEKDWTKHKFDQHSGCSIIEDAGEEDGQSEFTFYINVDNLYLQTEMKGSKDDPQVLRAKFVFGNVLMGLALIHEFQNRKPKEDNAEDQSTVEDAVMTNSRAMAPFLLPMIGQLAELSDEDIETFGQIGDDE